jgi:DNA-binding FrmR family transcriptional regulator
MNCISYQIKGGKMKTLERNTEKTEYLKSVVKQYFPSKSQPTKRGWELLEKGSNMTFEELMKEMKKMRKTSDKTCAILKAIEKADDGIKVMTLYKRVAEQKQLNKIINAIDTAYPDSKIANMVVHGASTEYVENIHRSTNELIKKAKELKMIIKSFKL